LLKRVCESAGLEVRRYRPAARRRADLLDAHGIELVIDVGANRGQYVAELHAHGYRGRIDSFEPSAEAYATLLERSAAYPSWHIHRLAASDENGFAELGVADNFSSLLTVEPRLVSLFPEATPLRTERVPASRLDAVGLELPARGRTLLKVDVQGCEHRVIAGASGILDRVGLIEVELSVVPLYRDQSLLAEMVCRLDEAGFALRCLEPVMRDRQTGESLQFDGVFARR
jgi:FkbM family methyltransferase